MHCLPRSFPHSVWGARSILPNSKHYLLGFWASIVNPLIYLKDKAPPGLETCIQQIAILYVDSRLVLAEVPSRGINGGRREVENLPAEPTDNEAQKRHSFHLPWTPEM